MALMNKKRSLPAGHMSESLTETFEPIIDRPMLNKYNTAVKVEHNTQPEDA